MGTLIEYCTVLKHVVAGDVRAASRALEEQLRRGEKRASAVEGAGCIAGTRPAGNLQRMA
jgi:hypothetical protein